ncbi:Schizosaccharomyces pombe specific protein [Schizosaccharomyces pombe]|uniref:Uncharacterized protein SPCC794.16 n=1 Tax=Schizosaccharomyces pombe (strain 972 / ATCC 24843) TaxID=284812 RepID=YCTG_SCHPO
MLSLAYHTLEQVSDKVLLRKSSYNLTDDDLQAVVNCTTTILEQRAVIDQIAYLGQKYYWVSVDGYNNNNYTISDEMENLLRQCINNYDDRANVALVTHNVYAVSGSHSELQLQEHYDYFGYGLPEDYDGQSSEYYDTDLDVVTDSSIQLSRRSGNKPDTINDNSWSRYGVALAFYLFTNGVQYVATKHTPWCGKC